MAIYVTSDAHGHVRALDEALSKISLTSDDTLYVLGDMIDRGPDPVGVIKLVRSLPNARVLKGNHEQIMLDAIIGQDPLDAETSSEVAALLRNASDMFGQTIVMVTHDRQMADFADRVLVIKDGVLQ